METLSLEPHYVNYQQVSSDFCNSSSEIVWALLIFLICSVLYILQNFLVA